VKPKVYYAISQSARDRYWCESQLQALGDFAEVVLPDDPSSPWESAPADLQGVVIGWGAPKLPEEAWKRLEALKIVSIFGGSAQVIENAVGLIRRGVVVSNVAHEIGEGVAEEAVALMLAARLEIVNSAIRYRERADRSIPGRIYDSLSGSTVGLIGFGFVARHVAGLLRAFGVRLLVCDPYADEERLESFGAERSSLEDLLSASDVISLHAGWTSETEGMLNAARLAMIRPGAVVVSTARMPIFDQAALAECVRAGKFSFASDFIALDEEVWSDPATCGCENLIGVHGHTSVTHRTLRRMGDRVVSDMRAVLAGEGDVGHRVTEEWIIHTT